jgi:hypothetical protein
VREDRAEKSGCPPEAPKAAEAVGFKNQLSKEDESHANVQKNGITELQQMLSGTV